MTHTKAVGSRREVMSGTAHHTAGGLLKKDLKKNPKTGEYVSKDKAKAGKKNPWIKAVAQAKKDLGIKKKGLPFDSYSLAKGTPLYRRAHEIYDK
jgi:hypothetical protein